MSGLLGFLLGVVVTSAAFYLGTHPELRAGLLSRLRTSKDAVFSKIEAAIDKKEDAK